MSSLEIPTNTFNAVSINITGSNDKLKFIGNFIHIRIVLKQIANLFYMQMNNPDILSEAEH